MYGCVLSVCVLVCANFESERTKRMDRGRKKEEMLHLARICVAYFNGMDEIVA